MRTYLRPTALARYLDLAPQRISQLVNRGVLDPPGPDGFDADLVRVRYIRHLRANLVTHATAGLTEERSKLVRAQRERLEFKTARDAARYVSVEEVDHQFATVRTRLVGHPGRLCQRHRRGGAASGRHKRGQCRRRSAPSLGDHRGDGILLPITADKTRKAAA